MGRAVKPKDGKAQIIADAQQLSVAAAAKKHKLSVRTVQRFRKETETDPELAADVHARRLAAQKRLAETTAKAVQLAYEAMVAILESETATSNEKLAAFKILTDRVSADQATALMFGSENLEKKMEPA